MEDFQHVVLVDLVRADLVVLLDEGGDEVLKSVGEIQLGMTALSGGARRGG
jgi:hypothetical protein